MKKFLGLYISVHREVLTMVNPVASNHVPQPVNPIATNQASKGAPGAKTEAPKGKGAAVDTVEFSQAALKKSQETTENKATETGESSAQETQESNGSNAVAVQTSVSGGK
jgi:hypothetical protein